MITCLTETTQKARKDYQCDACSQITYGISFKELIETENLSESEKQALIKAKENKYKIKKGDKYVRWACVNDGSIYTVRAIPEVSNICTKLEMWSEE